MDKGKRLEQFVRDHREEFDSEEPGQKIYDKVRDQLRRQTAPPKSQRTVVLRFTKISLRVAAALLIVLAGLTWWLNARHTSQKPLAVVHIPDSSSAARHPVSSVKPDTAVDSPATSSLTADIPEDAGINEEMFHYARLVEIKQKELKRIEKDEPQLYRQFSADLYKLDSVYHNLQRQLTGTPNRAQLLEAMLQDLQLQMKLLNHQLGIIKQIDHSKKNMYDTTYKTL